MVGEEPTLELVDERETSEEVVETAIISELHGGLLLRSLLISAPTGSIQSLSLFSFQSQPRFISLHVVLCMRSRSGRGMLKSSRNTNLPYQACCSTADLVALWP